MENASRRYSGREIKQMIERQREKYGWEFLFLGANVDAFADAERIGIDRDHATNYHADGMGLKVCYRTLSASVSKVRCGRKLSKKWKEVVVADYEKRKPNR